MSFSASLCESQRPHRVQFSKVDAGAAASVTTGRGVTFLRLSSGLPRYSYRCARGLQKQLGAWGVGGWTLGNSSDQGEE